MSYPYEESADELREVAMTTVREMNVPFTVANGVTETGDLIDVHALSRVSQSRTRRRHHHRPRGRTRLRAGGGAMSTPREVFEALLGYYLSEASKLSEERTGTPDNPTWQANARAEGYAPAQALVSAGVEAACLLSASCGGERFLRKMEAVVAVPRAAA